MKKLRLLCLYSLFISTLTAENWPQFRGLQNNGHGQGVLDSPFNAEKKLWSFDLKGKGSSSPVIWEKKLFITAQSENGLKLIAINTENGQKIWAREISTGAYHTHKFNNAAASTPCLSANFIVLPWYNAKTQKATLSCFSHDGDKVWEKQLVPNIINKVTALFCLFPRRKRADSF